MIARDSFEKSLPRFASAAPFLCLIVDHLLCPDTRRLRDQIEELAVDPGVVRQLGMECGDEHAPVPEQDGLPVELCEHLDLRADVADARGADEDAAEGPLLALQHEVGLEARHLPPVRVPVDDEVGQPEVVAVEEDHPRARAEDRRREPADRLVETVERCELQDRRRLAARDHEPVESVELLGETYLDDVRAGPTEHPRVLAKGPLQGQDTDPRAARHGVKCRSGPTPGSAQRGSYQPRTSSRSASASELAEMPTIGSPSPADTSARIFGSLKCVVASTIALARRSGSPDLKIPEPTKTPSAPSCMHCAASAGVAIPPAVKVTTGSRPFSATQRISSYGARWSLAAA